MKMVCPQCQESYENQLSCPQCGVRLTFPKSGTKPASSGALAGFAHSDAYRQVPEADQAEEPAPSGGMLQVLLLLAAFGGAALAGFLAWRLTKG